MTIEHPRFSTPEDERRAALLYQALRQSADIDGVKKTAEANPVAYAAVACD